MLLFERSTKRVLGLKQLHKDTNKKPAETFDLSGRDYSFQTAFMEFSFSIHTAFQTASPLPSSLLARQLNGPYFFFLFVKYHGQTGATMLGLGFGASGCGQTVRDRCI